MFAPPCNILYILYCFWRHICQCHNIRLLFPAFPSSSEPLKSPPMPIVGPSPNLKPRSTSTGGSTESPPRNPQLDDIILKNMNSVSLGGIKPPLPPKPLLHEASDLSNIKTPQQTAAHKFIGKRSKKRSASLKHSRNSHVNPTRDFSKEERDNILLEKEDFLQKTGSLSQTRRLKKQHSAPMADGDSVGKLRVFVYFLFHIFHDHILKLIHAASNECIVQYLW